MLLARYIEQKRHDRARRRVNGRQRAGVSKKALAVPGRQVGR